MANKIYESAELQRLIACKEISQVLTVELVEDDHDMWYLRLFEGPIIVKIEHVFHYHSKLAMDFDVAKLTEVFNLKSEAIL